MSVQIVQQPDQHQLGIRLRFDPQLDRPQRRHNSISPKSRPPFFPCLCEYTIKPMRTWLLVRPAVPTPLRVPYRLAVVPRQTKAERNHDVGKAGIPQAPAPQSSVVRIRRVIASLTLRPQYGFISAGFQRHRRSLVRCVPPHQRSIGLCRLKSSLWARTALPNSVSDSSASQVSRVPVAQIFAVERAQFLVEARHGRSRAMRKPIQQVAVFPLAEDACLAQFAEMEERIRAQVSPRDQLEHPHFCGAKSCRTMTAVPRADRSRRV